MPSEPGPTADGYTVPELGRLIRANAELVNQLATRLDALLDRMDDRYQRRDLAEAMAANQQSRIHDLRDDVEALDSRFRAEVKKRDTREEDREKEQRAMRRLVLSALLFPILVAVVSGLILAVVL